MLWYHIINEQLSELKIKLLKSYSIPEKQFSNHGLHPNLPGKVMLAMNFIPYVNKIWSVYVVMKT